MPKFPSALCSRKNAASPADGNPQFALSDVLKLPPISQHGNVTEILGIFGCSDQLRNAVSQPQNLLYAA